MPKHLRARQIQFAHWNLRASYIKRDNTLHIYFIKQRSGVGKIGIILWMRLYAFLKTEEGIL